MQLPIPFLIPGFPGRSTAVIGIKATSPQKRLWWNWEYDRQLYPQWREFIEKLRVEYGVKVMSYINPFLSDVAECKPADSWERNYFKEASEKGYLVKRWVKIKRNASISGLNIKGVDGHVGPGGRELLEMQHTIED